MLGAAPITPQEMQWRVSYETVEFDTPDGELDFDQYAVADDGVYYIRTVPKNVGQVRATTSLEAIEGKELVAIRCERCAYYDEFLDPTGGRHRFKSTAADFDALRSVPDHPQPSKSRLVPVLAARTADAAIAYDADTQANDVDANTSTSFSHSVTGSNPFLIVGCAISDPTAGDRDISAVTYNSRSATSTQRYDDTSNTKAVEIFHLAAPSTGSNTVSITYAGGGPSSSTCTATSFTGVHQTYPVEGKAGSMAPNSTGGASTTVAVSSANSWAVDIGVTNDFLDTMAVGPGQTNYYLNTDDGAATFTSSGSYEGPASRGAIQMSWTCAACSGTEDWVVAALSFREPCDPSTSKCTDVFSIPGYWQWTVPTSVSSVDIACWGGGGGAGDGTSTGGGGGGAGAFASSTASVSAGDIIRLFVGAGGSRATVANTKGNAGATSTASTTAPTLLVSAAPGWGGGNGSSADTIGGVGGSIASSTGTVVQSGGNGGGGLNTGDAGGAGGGAGGPHGNGGNGGAANSGDGGGGGGANGGSNGTSGAAGGGASTNGGAGGHGDANGSNALGGRDGYGHANGGGGGGGGDDLDTGGNGGAPGGGGGGGENTEAINLGNGADGECSVTYTESGPAAASGGKPNFFLKGKAFQKGLLYKK